MVRPCSGEEGEVVMMIWQMAWCLKGLFLPGLPPLPALVAAAIVIAIGAATGTHLASLRAVPLVYEQWAFFGVFIGATLALVGSLVSRLRYSIRIAWRWLLLALGLAAVAWGWCSGRLFPGDDLAWSLIEAPRPVAVTGRVLQGPQSRLMRPSQLNSARQVSCSEWLIELTEARHHDAWKPVSGRARVFVDGPPAVLPVTSLVRVFGRGLRPSPALNPGEYDFADKARRDRNLSLIRVRDWSSVIVQSPPVWWSLRAAIDRLRGAAAAQLTSSLPDAERPLGFALLLGRRQALSQECLRRFAVTGTSHLLAISGLHVGMLLAAVTACLGCLSLSRCSKCVAVAGVVTVYATVVGNAVPVWRATLLVWAGCLAVWLGRRTGGLRPLALAAIVLVALDPSVSIRVGTHLSFLATAVLLTVAPLLVPQPIIDPVERLLDGSRPPYVRLFRSSIKRCGSLALAGCSVWVVAAPLVADSFQRLSPIAIGVNLLLVPVMSVAMAAGFCCLLLGGLLPVVGWVSGGICGSALWCLNSIVTAATQVPWGSWRVVTPPAWWLLGWYMLVSALLLCWATAHISRQRIGSAQERTGLLWGVFSEGLGRHYAILLIAWAGVGLAATYVPTSHVAGIRVVLAAMGHGCGVVIRTQNNHCLVYDAGRLGSGQAAARSLSAVLVSERIRTIDCLVLSHADADHFNAVPEIIEQFSVRLLVVSEDFLKSDSSLVHSVLVEVAKLAVPLRTVKAGDQIDIDPDCTMQVLHPGDGQQGTDNERSVVLAVKAAGRRLLLTGDLEGPALQQFLDSGPPRCDVLVAPHHGSHTCMPGEIVAKIKPKLVLVSGSGGRRWQAVATAFREGGRLSIPVLRTASADPHDRGAIAVQLNETRIEVSRFTESGWLLLDSASVFDRRDKAVSLLNPIKDLGEATGKWLSDGCVTGAPNRSYKIEGQQTAYQKQHGTADQSRHLPAIKICRVNTESVL